MTKADEIIAGYIGGKTVIEIAKEQGLSRERIYQYLRKLPDFKQTSVKKRAEVKAERLSRYDPILPEIIQMRKDGIGVEKISKTFGITFRTVSQLLEGTPYTNTHLSKVRRNKKIAKGYASGISQVNLAQKYDLCQSAISAILIKQFNGKLPKRPTTRG